MAMRQGAFWSDADAAVWSSTTQSAALNIYEEAFRGNIQYGYATAKSTVLFIIVLAITAIQLTVMKRREEEL